MKYQELFESVDEPAHEHDCERCVFVGADTPEPGEPNTNQVDMYFHPGKSPQLIRRFSSDGANYSSRGIEGYGPMRPNFQKVLDAAKQAGLYND